MRAGQRVFWHGIFPRFQQQGTIKRTGTIRHEVLWDGAEATSLEYPGYLMAVSQYGKCCPYCADRKRQTQAQLSAADIAQAAGQARPAITNWRRRAAP